MSLSKEQIEILLDTVASVTEDCLDCDGCFEHLSEFAENELAGRTVPEALAVVETHLQNCPCCCDEYKILLSALRECDADEPI